MTETASPGINQYIGTGSVATYAFTFRTFSSSDLQIWEQPSGGTPTQKTVGVDYTVSGAGSYTGGTVTRVAGNLPSGTRLTIKRVLAIQQTTDLRNQGEYLAETQETALDRLTMMVKQQDEKIGRAILAPDTDSALGKLPPASERALQMSGFDASGNPIAAQPSSALVSSAMQPVVAAATLAAARSAMGPWGDAIVTATGATAARSLADRVRLDVRDFGAIGDGATDSYAAVTAMVAALPAYGGEIVFPSGDWVISQQVNIANKDVSIIGYGSGVSKVIFNGASTGGFYFSDTSITVNTMKILNVSGLTISTNKTGFTAIRGTWYPALAFFHRNHCIHDVQIITEDLEAAYYWGKGVYLTNGRGGSVRGLHVINQINAGTLYCDAIHYDGQSLANAVYDFRALYCHTGIRFGGLSVKVIDFNGQTVNFVTGEMVTSSSGGIGLITLGATDAGATGTIRVWVISGTFLVGNTLSSTGGGNGTIGSVNTRTVMSEGMYVFGGEAVDCDYGVQVETPTDALGISPGHAYHGFHVNSRLVGFLLTGVAHGNVTGCVVYASGNGSKGVVLEGCSGVSVVGCSIVSSASGYLTAYAIQLNSATIASGTATTDDCAIIGNKLIQCFIGILNTASGVNMDIFGNGFPGTTNPVSNVGYISSETVNSTNIALLLGNYRIWVDGSGRLRIKSTAPSSDTDGTVIGTQT